MGKPSIDGLKLALHDHFFCVANNDEDPNNIPNLHLTQLDIKGMMHCGSIGGKPASFKLHPLFNAVIGGRGSGKSTIIESIRLALGKDSELQGLDKLKSDLESFKHSVTSDRTEISVVLSRREDVFKASWNNREAAFIDKNIEGAWKRDHGKPSDRFPVSVYSQKQINALSDNPNSLWDIIDKSKEVDFQSWEKNFQN